MYISTSHSCKFLGSNDILCALCKKDKISCQKNVNTHFCKCLFSLFCTEHVKCHLFWEFTRMWRPCIHMAPIVSRIFHKVLLFFEFFEMRRTSWVRAPFVRSHGSIPFCTSKLASIHAISPGAIACHLFPTGMCDVWWSYAWLAHRYFAWKMIISWRTLHCRHCPLVRLFVRAWSWSPPVDPLNSSLALGTALEFLLSLIEECVNSELNPISHATCTDK